MGRDMTGCGRYAPTPKFAPLAFYGAVRLGDPEMLAEIMHADPYFVTQDNGAGAPVHFATTFRQLDMLHHLLNNGAEVNQRDPKGFTPLHRAAYLAHMDGYLQIYEYLLSRGADPSIRSRDFDPYLNPGCKLPVDVAVEDEEVRQDILALEKKYAGVAKAREPHGDIGDWWALYDFGLDAIKDWQLDFKPPYPEVLKRQRDKAARKAVKALQRKKRDDFLATYKELGAEAAAAALSSGPKEPSPVVFVFPGQGSQAVGMLSASRHLPAVQAMLTTAERILGYDLLDVCLNGPKEKLDNTEYSQPALFVAGLAAVELLRSQGPEGAAAVANCGAAAGLSLGEYCALVFAGALTFEEGIKVVKVRSQSMAAAAALGEPHGMLSVVGLEDTQLKSICDDVIKAMPPNTVCCVANQLFPKGRVVSGHTAALQRVSDKASAAGALKVQMLAVAGAFHTSLMLPASQALKKVLAEVEVRTPRIPVYSNVTATPFPEGAAEISSLLARQLLEPVLWETTLSTLLTGTGPKPKILHELGPGMQIKAMVRRLDQEAWKAFKNIQP